MLWEGSGRELIMFIHTRFARLFKNPLTTPDVKASVEDLKVLGKKDFKILLKYRLAVREDVRICSSSRCASWSTTVTYARLTFYTARAR